MHTSRKLGREDYQMSKELTAVVKGKQIAKKLNELFMSDFASEAIEQIFMSELIFSVKELETLRQILLRQNSSPFWQIKNNEIILGSIINKQL